MRRKAEWVTDEALWVKGGVKGGAELASDWAGWVTDGAGWVTDGAGWITEGA